MSQGYVGQGPAAAVNRAGVKPCPKKTSTSKKRYIGWMLDTDEGCLEPYYESDMLKNIVCNHPFDTAVGNTIGIAEWDNKFDRPSDAWDGCYPKDTVESSPCLVDTFPKTTQCGGFTLEEGAKRINTRLDDDISANWNQTGELKFRHVDFKVYRVFVNDSKTERYEYHALLKGCTCLTDEYYGEFCHIKDPTYDAWAVRSACFNMAAHVVAVVVACFAVSFA